MRNLIVASAMLLYGAAAVADEPDELLRSEYGEAFGHAPAMWGPRLSPTGSGISFIQMHPDGMTIARVLDRETGNISIVMAGEKDEFDVSWCNWANEERLLCGLRAAVRDRPMTYAVTRLAAVNRDGNEMRVLVTRRLDNEYAQLQDRIVDWLPDDREHVLIQEPGRNGSGVSRLNIYDGGLGTVERERSDVYSWVSDGYGEPRLFRRTDAFNHIWYVKRAAGESWEALREIPIADIDSGFAPLGFGAQRDELLYFDYLEGRRALYGLNLVTNEERLVYSNDTLDVSRTRSLGKHRRLVAAVYIDSSPRLHFFDERTEQIQDLLADQFPGMSIGIVDEDWDQRNYLVSVSSDTDPGAWYLLDVGSGTLSKLSDKYPRLANVEMATMREIYYVAGDGAEIPAYLTVLPDAGDQPPPAVILPHGGPSSRDYVTFDLLAQFFAAQGYAVLQSNYRGSSGYGREWEGDGAFQGWRQAVSDISDGVTWLATEEIADPDRICIVGWSFGGYAALMSIIEEPERYQCAVSIAGVTDPKSLGVAMRNFVGGRAAQLFIGSDDEVIRAGSPLERVSEIAVPLLLFHAEKDINVPFQQSRQLARDLGRAGTEFQFIEYEHAEHDIEPERYRIDMLSRLESFLHRHIGADTR